MKTKTKHFSSKILSFCALSLVCACLSTGALAQTKGPAKPPMTSKVKGLLYEVRLMNQDDATIEKTNNKAKPPIAYLFASVHIAKKDFHPMSVPVQKAYAQADTIMVEADSNSDSAVQAIASKLSYSAPDKLEKHVSQAVWGTLKAMAGKSVDQFQSYTPVMVAMGLSVEVSMQLGFDPTQSIDLHFINAAKKDNKALIELDGLEFQADVLGSLNDDEGNALLANTLDSFRKGELKSQLQSMNQAWLKADANGIEKILLEAGNRDEGSKKIMNSLMDDRNEGIANKIRELMQQGKKAFIVLNAGHMAGERSIIAQLKQQGLQVKQIR
ncbi:TraB/GumN family protein [Undibacterium sp. Di24W]|uniref:TraB/GumN family protein n=1 Tax=Undibacterium sp. Di24W TaxID=3413033 RepID=UPI003BF42766